MLFCKTVQQFLMKDYDRSKETVKVCLSHWYVMKLHRHTSHENDNITTHKWPQFVPDDVEHDNIYIMNEFICICCRNSLRQKKNKDAWSGMCKWSTVAHDILQDLQNILPLERESDFSKNPIHNNTSHEMMCWSLQSKWSQQSMFQQH